MRDIRGATVQFQHAPGDRAYNLGRVRHFVTGAARAGVELVAFPERCMFLRFSNGVGPDDEIRTGNAVVPDPDFRRVTRPAAPPAA